MTSAKLPPIHPSNAYFDAQSFDFQPLVALPDLVARDDFATTLVDTPVTLSPLHNDDVNGDPSPYS